MSTYMFGVGRRVCRFFRFSIADDNLESLSEFSLAVELAFKAGEWRVRRTELIPNGQVAKVLVVIACPLCGVEFIPSKRGQVYCSVRHANIASTRAAVERTRENR